MGIPSYAALLDCCYAAGDLPALLRGHALILKTGLLDHHLLRTKLCAAYASCGRLSESHLLLSFATRRPAFLYNSLIRAHANCSRFSSALSLFQLMLSDSVAPNAASLASALRSVAALASLRLGRLLHAHIVVSSLLSEDLAVPNSLISMYSACGDLASARKVFDEMHQRKNLVSYTSMITALGAHGHGRESVALFEAIIEKGERPDAKALTAILAACSREGMVEEGWRVFRMLKERRFGDLRPGLEHYTCMVGLMGTKGCMEEAERLMGEIEGEPDEAMLVALLKACELHGTLDVPERVWSVLLATCRRQGRLDVAMTVAEKVYGKQK